MFQMDKEPIFNDLFFIDIGSILSKSIKVLLKNKNGF